MNTTNGARGKLPCGSHRVLRGEKRNVAFRKEFFQNNQAPGSESPRGCRALRGKNNLVRRDHLTSERRGARGFLLRGSQYSVAKRQFLPWRARRRISLVPLRTQRSANDSSRCGGAFGKHFEKGVRRHLNGVSGERDNMHHGSHFVSLGRHRRRWVR